MSNADFVVLMRVMVNQMSEIAHLIPKDDEFGQELVSMFFCMDFHVARLEKLVAE